MFKNLTSANFLGTVERLYGQFAFFKKGVLLKVPSTMVKK